MSTLASPAVVARGARSIVGFVRTSPVGAVGAVIVLAFAALALAASFVHGAAYDLDLLGRLEPVAWADGGSSAHVLGTDTLGRDVLARIMTAIRISLTVAIAAVALAGVVGVLLGMTAGYFGGWLDDAIMRLTDSVLAIPIVLLAISVIAVLGSGLLNLILVIAFIQWTIYARTARAETLVLREQPYVVAARSFGGHDLGILARHILPHLLPSAIALTTLNISTAVLLEAGLSYLGLGVQLPDPSLGSMLAEGRQYIEAAGWLAIYPGLALFLLVLGMNLLGDGLRSYLDPHTRVRGR